MYVISIVSISASHDRPNLSVLNEVLVGIIDQTVITEPPELYLDPEGERALIGLFVPADADYPEAVVGRVASSLGEQFLSTPVEVTVYMASPTPGACPVCGGVDRHDLARHAGSRLFAEGLVEVRGEPA